MGPPHAEIKNPVSPGFSQTAAIANTEAQTLSWRGKPGTYL